MKITSIYFLLFVVISAALLRMPLKHPSRDIRLMALNIVFITGIFTDRSQLFSALLFIALGYVSLCLIRFKHSGRTLFATVSMVVISFVWLKQYTGLSHLLPSPSAVLHTPISVVGLSYILFRVLHTLIDYRQGMLEFPGIIRFFNYCLFFPCFLSGPIHRLQNFNEQMSRPLPALSVPVLSDAIARITKGFVMIFVVSGEFSMLTEWGQNNFYQTIGNFHSICWFTLGSVFYLGNLYANFSGYMDIVIGAGAICGFEVPENFNKPYLSKSFFDLWSRWHITLSNWFKYYVFNPLLKLLVSRWTQKEIAPYLGAFAYFVTFFVMGIWHGTTKIFAVYGLLLGFGATINKIWQILMIKAAGKEKSKALANHPLYQSLGNALTLGYFSIALVCLWIDTSKLDAAKTGYLFKLGFLGLALTTALCFAIAMAVGFIARLYRSCITSMPKLDFLRPNRVLIDAFSLSIIFYILIVAQEKVPDFIYKAF